MKLKRLPDDFQVEELADFAPGRSGDFALYRLVKRGIGSLEAMDAVCRRWRIARGQMSCCGLKDRHALTTQFVSLRRGPRRGLRQTNLELDYLGQIDRAVGPHDIRGNRFRIVVRSMTDREVAAAREAIEDVVCNGLPNYFDDQRFGSVSESGEFVGRAWIRGDWERTLWLALADANRLDRSRDRDEKRLLREHWGDWATCRAKLRQSVRRVVVSHLLDHAGDFRGALARIRAEERGLYLAAFQSHLWNRLLAAYLEQAVPAHQLVSVPLKLGDAPFFMAIDEPTRSRIESVELPLPSARMHLEAGPVKELVERTLAESGLAMREIRVKYPRDSFFSKGWRPAASRVAALSHDTAPDELYPGHTKLNVEFDLPRGSYATILIKRISIAAADRADIAVEAESCDSV
jgi:tRNA pseudouridine13 synthase